MKKSLDPKQIGNLTELKCISAFYELGYSISIPYGENSRYDFIADINSKLIRIQVKTSKAIIEDECYIFSCRSSRSTKNHTINKKYTSEEIDYFCTFIKDKCYLIPITECSTNKTLRFKKPKNNNNSNCYNLASDYELEIQLNKLINNNLVESKN